MKKVLKTIALASFTIAIACGESSKTNGSDINQSESANEMKEEYTGDWMEIAQNDEFGNPTDNKIIAIKGQGSYSNSATTSAELTAYLVVDTAFMSLNLLKHGNYPVTDENTLILKIKDEQGKKHEFGFLHADKSGNIIIYRRGQGFIHSLNKALGDDAVKRTDVESDWRCEGLYGDECYDMVLEILRNNKNISLSVVNKGEPDTYLFKLHTEGFAAAFKKVYGI